MDEKTHESVEENVCEECGGTGEVFEDEFENGQCVGRGTVTKKCICRMKDPDDYQEEDSGCGVCQRPDYACKCSD